MFPRRAAPSAETAAAASSVEYRERYEIVISRISLSTDIRGTLVPSDTSLTFDRASPARCLRSASAVIYVVFSLAASFTDLLHCNAARIKPNIVTLADRIGRLLIRLHRVFCSLYIPMQFDASDSPSR